MRTSESILPGRRQECIQHRNLQKVFKKDTDILERVQKRATNMIRRLEPLLRGKAERVGVVQPGEEQALERTYIGLPVLKRDLQEN